MVCDYLQGWPNAPVGTSEAHESFGGYVPVQRGWIGKRPKVIEKDGKTVL